MQILHEDFRAVGFEGDAVYNISINLVDSSCIHTITIIDNRILNDDILRAIDIPAIRILGRIVAFAEPADVDPVKQHVRRVCDEMVPLRRVAQLQRTDRAPVQADDAHQDRPQDQVVLRVQVVPHLPVAVQRAGAVDVDVFAAELEEGRRVLEALSEGVRLPVVGVVGELDVAVDF